MGLTVSLVGFSGDGLYGYKVDLEILQKIVQESVGHQRPTCHENLEKLNVEFVPNIQIVTAQTHSIKRYQDLIFSQLASESSGTSLVYADRQEFVAFFDSLYHEIVSGPGQNHQVLFIMNPAIQKETASGDFETVKYGLVYGPTSVPAKAFTASEKYIVFDASATCLYGQLTIGEGAAIPESLFNLDHFASKIRHQGPKRLEDCKEIEAEIAATILSAVQRVFVPDIMWEHMHQADKILIPIIVFQNHNLWDALETAVDVDSINQIVRSQFELPGQEIQVITGKHSLHEHQQISLAVAKSIKTKPVHEVDLHHHFVVQYKPYVDSGSLMSEIRQSADALTHSLLSHHDDKDLLAAFLNPRNPSGVLFGKRQSQGTLVLPVYIFSLAGEEESLLLDGNGFVAFAKDMVVILQTRQQVQLPYHSYGVSIREDSKDVTRHIVAGLLSALGGVVPPSSHYSPPNHRIIFDFRWSVGHLPWGPFGASSGVSKIYSDQLMRNRVVSMINAAIKHLTEALKELEMFTSLYLYGPFGEFVQREKPQSLIDSIFHSRTSVSPIPLQTVDEVHRQLEKAQSSFKHIVTQLKQNDISQAYRLASTFKNYAAGTADYIKDQIAVTKKTLECCEVAYEPITPSIPIKSYLFLFVILACSGAVLSTVSYLLWLSPRKRRVVKRRF